MKKLVLAMACVLSLGLLAVSCKQSVPEADGKTEAYYVKGTVTFDAARVVTTGTFPSKSWTTTGAPTNTSLSATTAKAFARVSKTNQYESVDSNFDQYTVTFDVVYDDDTTSSTNVLSYPTASSSVTLYKIGDKWYTDSANIDANYSSTTKALVEFSEGDATGNFTIKSLGTVNWGTGNWSITNFKFVKAE